MFSERVSRQTIIEGPPPSESGQLHAVLDRIAEELRHRRDQLAPESLQSLLDDKILCRRGPRRFRANFGRTYRLSPALWARPRTTDELRRIVTFAFQQRIAIKPVGALYTWSPVARPVRIFGIALIMDRLNGIIDSDGDVMRPGRNGKKEGDQPILTAEQLLTTHHFVRVLAGTTILDLSAALHARGFSLKTMGAFGQEQIGGAFSTGTHGSSVSFGPMCDNVVSLDTFWQGVPVRIEPSNGPTDPVRFGRSPRYRDWLLVQDDTVFNAILLSYGTLGVVASYLIDVSPVYYLEEKRENIGRDAVRQEIRAVVEGKEGNIFERAYSAEFYFNLLTLSPNPAGVRIQRRLVTRPAKLTRGRWTFDEIVFRFLRLIRINPGVFFTRLFRAFPRRTPAILEFALNGLHGRYQNVSYRIYDMGSANLARTLVEEIAIPATHVDAYLDDCSQLARKLFESEGWSLTAPVAVRFIRPSRAMLAAQQSTIRDAAGNTHPVRLWTMVNIALTIGTPRGHEMLRLFYDASLKYGGRSHPGKCHFDSPDHMRRCYDLERYRTIRGVIDPDGCYQNEWSREIFSITPPMAGENAA